MAVTTTTESKSISKQQGPRQRQRQRQQKLLSFTVVVIISCLLVSLFCDTVVVHAQQDNNGTTTTNGNGDDDDSFILPDPNDGVNNSTINVDDISRPTGGGSGVPCYVCGGDSTDTITNVDIIQTLPGGERELSCKEIFVDGINGRIPNDHCCIYHNNVSFYNACGCVVTTTAKTKVGATNNGTEMNCSLIESHGSGAVSGDYGGSGNGPPRNVCYPCNDDMTASVSNPNVLIPVQNGRHTRSCQEILQDGIDGIIPTFECPIFQNSTLQFQQQCGCTYNTSTTPNNATTTTTTSDGSNSVSFVSFTTTTTTTTLFIIAAIIISSM